MARPDLFHHRKFLRLKGLLGLPNAYVLGHLEMLWHAAYSVGDATLGDTVDVEIVSGWLDAGGEPGRLAKALVECGGAGPGFIEEVPDEPGIYEVHDLFENAPQYVKDRQRKRAQRSKTASELGPPKAKAKPKQDEKAAKNVQDIPGAVQEEPGQVQDIPGMSKTPSQTRPDQTYPDRERDSESPEPGVAGSDPPPAATPPPDPDPVVLGDFPVVGGKSGKSGSTWEARRSRCDQWAEAYPALPIEAQLRSARQWLRDNPTRRKTARGMPRFIGSWLRNAQERGSGRGSTPRKVPTGADEQRMQAAREAGW